MVTITVFRRTVTFLFCLSCSHSTSAIANVDENNNNTRKSCSISKCPTKKKRCAETNTSYTNICLHHHVQLLLQPSLRCLHIKNSQLPSPTTPRVVQRLRTIHGVRPSLLPAMQLSLLHSHHMDRLSENRARDADT